MHIRNIIRILGVATLISMIIFHVLLLMYPLYEMGKISFYPTTVDFGVSLGAYIACLAGLALAENRYCAECDRGLSA